MKIDFAIATAAGWDERRKAPLKRLISSLHGTPLVRVSARREHAREWARDLWALIRSSAPADWIVLNDDVIPHPGLVPLVQQLLTVIPPDDIISLHGHLPGMREAADSGARLARCYWTSGPGYVLRHGHAAQILAWLDTVPPDWFDGDVNEDGVLAAWSWSRQRPAWCTIPALVRHDTTVPSTLPGYDDHPHRTSPVDWDDYPPRLWTADDVERAPYIQVPWMSAMDMQSLGNAIRGMGPLCGLCRVNPGNAVEVAKRGTGLCRGCAVQVARLVPQ